MANKIGISETLLSKIENKRREPTLLQMSRILAMLEIPCAGDEELEKLKNELLSYRWQGET